MLEIREAYTTKEKKEISRRHLEEKMKIEDLKFQISMLGDQINELRSDNKVLFGGLGFIIGFTIVQFVVEICFQ